jgi:hypothetical protein
MISTRRGIGTTTTRFCATTTVRSSTGFATISRLGTGHSADQPYCEKVDLWERAESNVGWLGGQLDSYDDTWDRFWHQFRRRSARGLFRANAYRAVADPRVLLKRRATASQGDLFDLPPGEYGMGTMFFVAESFTPDPGEFQRAVKQFVNCLRPGAPFAAAFMENSQGYDVADCHFPAVAVRRADVKGCLSGSTHDLRIRRIRSKSPLRDGYSGMILALGKAGAPKT